MSGQPRTGVERARRPRSADMVMLLALCLLAFAVRLHDLDSRSLWFDEGFTIRRIELPPAQVLANVTVFDGVASQDPHPALYFLVLKLLKELAGTTDFALKFLGVAWGVVLVPAAFAAGTLTVSPRAGRAAALLVALSPVYLWYAQELRMYTQLATLSLLAIYTLARANKLGGSLRWLLAALTIVAACNTHYSAFFLAGFEMLALVVIAYRTGRTRQLVALVLALLSTAPLIYAIVPRALTGAEPQYNFVPLDIIAKDLLNSFSLGISVKVESVWWLDLAFGAVLLAGALVPLKGQRLDWRGLPWLLIGYLVVPVLAYYGFTCVKPAYQGVRHLFVVSPAFYLLLGRGVAVLAERLRPVALAALVLFMGGMAYSIDQYFTNPKYLKDDLRSMVRLIEANAWPRDVILINNAFVQPVIEHYSEGDGLLWLTAPEVSLDLTTAAGAQAMAATLASLQAQHPHIWFIPGAPQDGRDSGNFVEGWLRQNTELVGRYDFHGRDTVVWLQQFMSAPMFSDALPAGVPPVDFTWQPGLRLEGARVRYPPDPFGGQMTPVELVWSALVPLSPFESYSVQIEVTDDMGSAWANVTAPIAPPVGDSAAWPVGKRVLVGHTLLLPPGTPPGRYHVLVALITRDGVVSLVDGSLAADVGEIQVKPAYDLPDARRIEPFTPASVRFDSGVELVGYRVASGGRPGQPVAVQLLWKALRSAPADSRVTLELIDWLGRRLAVGTGELSAPGYATIQWGQSQIVMSTVTLRLPGQMAGGWYRFRLGLTWPDGPAVVAFTAAWPLPSSTAELGPLYVAPWPMQTALPAEATPAGAAFADGVTLAGYQVVGDVSPGAAVTVTLYWRAEQALPASAASLVAYVHIVDGTSGQAVVLDDHTPAGGDRPVDTWRVGEIIADPHALRLPAEARPGRDSLFVGLYQSDTMQRWPVVLNGVGQPDDQLRLTDLFMGAP